MQAEWPTVQRGFRPGQRHQVESPAGVVPAFATDLAPYSIKLAFTLPDGRALDHWFDMETGRRLGDKDFVPLESPSIRSAGMVAA